MRVRRRRSVVDVSSSVMTSGIGYVRELSGIDEDDFLNVEAMGELAMWLMERSPPSPSREAIYESFALAYAIWLADCRSGLFLQCFEAVPAYRMAGGTRYLLANPSYDPAKPRPVHLRDYLKRLPKDPSAGPEPFLELIMVYEPATSDPKLMQKRQRQISRDARAMHYLVEQEITPAEVVKLSRQKGENLDTWSRRAAKRRSLSPSVNSPHAVSGALFQATITVQFNRHDEALSWRIWDEDLIKKLITQLSEWSEDRPEAVSQGSTIKRGPPNAL